MLLPQFIPLQMKLVKCGDFTAALETVVSTIHLAGEEDHSKTFLAWCTSLPCSVGWRALVHEPGLLSMGV